MKTGKAFAVTSYTNDAWTDVVAENADVTAVRVCNTSLTDPIIFELRRGAAQLTAARVVEAGDSLALNAGTLRVTTAAPLQIRCSGAGIHVTADAVVEVV